MKNILFIHQSAELYGSDKTLLLLLKNLDKSIFFPIVVLPNEGPLKVELEKENIKIVIAPVLKLYRKMFTLKNVFLFLKDVKNANALLNKLNDHYKFDIVYSNTLAVLLGFFFAKKNKIKHVWHVHEIITSPIIIKKIFTYLLSSKGNSEIIFNSNATARFWLNSTNKNFSNSIVWNGLETTEYQLSKEQKIKLKLELFNSPTSEKIIGLVGRISSWKGQKLLLDAFEKLPPSNYKLVFIGSPPPNQEFYLEELTLSISLKKLQEKVIVIPFQKNINEVWQLLDIAVVASIEPEPFGLVAVEAMLANKPVIAANHGGLTEIVKHNETGLLFEPGNIESLKDAIEILVASENLCLELGNRGYKRAIENFSVESYSNNIQNILKNL